jgi:hypothetical protein
MEHLWMPAWQRGFSRELSASGPARGIDLGNQQRVGHVSEQASVHVS